MFRPSFRILLAGSFALLALFHLHAEHKIKGSMTIDADTSRYWEETLSIKAKLGIDYDLASGMELELSLYMDEFEINPDSLILSMKAGDRIKLEAGFKENFLTLEERISSFDRPVNKTGLITEYYDYLGYVARYVGVEANHKDHWYAKGGMSYIYPYEPQFNGSYFFHPFGRDSFYGGSILYLGNYRTINIDHGDNPHHFAFTLHVTDKSGPWLYSLEMAMGSNYPAPIGYMTLPTADSEQSYFLGFDSLLAYEFMRSEIRWIPGLRYSLLIPDQKYPEYFKQRAVLANQLYITEDVKVFLDLFWEHERPYLDISGEENEYSLSAFVGLQVKTN